MQDFAPFIPEFQAALSGPQTPGPKGRRASSQRPHQFACYFSFFLLLLQNLLTSLQ